MQIAMKKKFVMAAIAVLMGVGCYLGYRSTTRTNAGESDLLLANAEALARDEVVNIPCIQCDGETCTFEAKLADGSTGNMTLTGMKKVNK